MTDRGTDRGFSLVELMVVVLIIGILVAIAIPVYNITKTRAQRRTCYANQRTIEGAVQMWVAADETRDRSDLAGVITGGHELIGPHIFHQPPRCPSVPEPDDAMTVDAAHGAYTLDANANVIGCTFGNPAHGLYR